MRKLLACLLLVSLSGCYVAAPPPPPVVYSPYPYYYAPGYYAPAPTVYGPPISIGFGYWHRH